MKPKIAVLGSINMDLVFKTPRMPAPGETLMGDGFHQIHGGKGANQAVAAARMGAEVDFIACVGDDDFGSRSLKALSAEGIHTEHIRTIEGCATGVAGILLDQHGENSIILAPGANAELSHSDVEAARSCIEASQILVCQLETPISSVAKAIHQAHETGVKVILNPAPMQKLDDDLLASIDYLILNETETEQLTGIAVKESNDALVASHQLQARGIGTVIITLGGHGVFVAAKDESYALPAYQVDVVDTTGAGDTFVGSFAVGLAEGMPLRDACDLAQRAAALAVTQLGAQTSIPHRASVERHFR